MAFIIDLFRAVLGFIALTPTTPQTAGAFVFVSTTTVRVVYGARSTLLTAAAAVCSL